LGSLDFWAWRMGWIVEPRLWFWPDLLVGVQFFSRYLYVWVAMADQISSFMSRGRVRVLVRGFNFFLFGFLAPLTASSICNGRIVMVVHIVNQRLGGCAYNIFSSRW